MREFGISKGTAREALKPLEVQGLVKLRTGPGGGATVVDVELQSLERCIDFCSCGPFGAQTGRQQRIVELDCHDVLSDASPNPALGFYAAPSTRF